MDEQFLAENLARLEVALDRLGRSMTSAAVAHLSVVPGPLLSGSQRGVLRALVNRGPCQVSEVANHLCVTLSAATGLVDRLVKAKLVTRDRDQKDRRVVWVKVTPDGVAALEGAEERRRVALGKIMANLSNDDLSTLCDILERIDNP